MCGITGAVWSSQGTPVAAEALDRMTDVLAHRGPDGRGTLWRQYQHGGGVALGHRRLSIIDLAGGKQPMSNEDGTIWITFNGEVYNYRQLRQELESKGHHFRTNSDTETIVHLYEEEGVECLPRLRGMFSFAIWDTPRRRLFLARDRLGQKPLVYHREPGRLLFASEIKSVLQVSDVERQVDPLALDEYLTYSYVPHPRTMFSGIHKLPPAHYAVFEDDQLTIRRYWSPDFESALGLSVSELRDRLDGLLGESVRLRLRSDVSLGAFLSGGIDSITIAGLMQRHLNDCAKTYTIGFPNAQFDETEPAREAATHLATDHHQMQVQPDSVGLLPVLAWHFDEPFGDSSAIPTYYVAQMAREHVKVALTGDGGDELFAGYPRYRTINQLGWFDRLPFSLQRIVANPLWQLLPNSRPSSLPSRLRFRMAILGQPLERRYLNWVESFHGPHRHELYTPEIAAGLEKSTPEQFIAQAMQQSRLASPGARAMHTDLLTYLPCDLLAKVDITSMAHGLECRSPFLDHKVVELATTVPFRIAMSGSGVKPLLTSTFSKLIPQHLRKRPKMGFSVPLDDWFRGDLRRFANDLLLDGRSLARGYFRPQKLKKLLEDHNAGHWNHGDRIWSLLFLEVWHRTFIDPIEPPTAPVSLEWSSTTPLRKRCLALS